MISSRLPAALAVAALLALAGPAPAQTGAPVSGNAAGARTDPADVQNATGNAAAKDAQKDEQRVEQIRHEDAGSRIDELRVGGETRTITVQPKNGHTPAYEITPPSNNVNPSNTDHNNQGGSRWKVLSY